MQRQRLTGEKVPVLFGHVREGPNQEAKAKVMKPRLWDQSMGRRSLWKNMNEPTLLGIRMRVWIDVIQSTGGKVTTNNSTLGRLKRTSRRKDRTKQLDNLRNEINFGLMTSTAADGAELRGSTIRCGGLGIPGENEE